MGRPLGSLNKFYIRPNKLYVPLDNIPDMDWLWDDKEVVNFDIFWQTGMPIKEMAEALNKSELSILFMAFDRMLKEKIEPREGWHMW